MLIILILENEQQQGTKIEKPALVEETNSFSSRQKAFQPKAAF